MDVKVRTKAMLGFIGGSVLSLGGDHLYLARFQTLKKWRASHAKDGVRISETYTEMEDLEIENPNKEFGDRDNNTVTV